jgi:hypothetical protein
MTLSVLELPNPDVPIVVVSISPNQIADFLPTQCPVSIAKEITNGI